MGSGTNRRYWGAMGSRSGRRSGSKRLGSLTRRKMLAARAEAARRSNPVPA